MPAAFAFYLSLRLTHQLNPAHAKKVRNIIGKVSARKYRKASGAKTFSGLPVLFDVGNLRMSVLINVRPSR
jgi:hypothetical protein